MAETTFGRELVRLRTRRGISQFDLAVCMDWKGTNPVVQLEKDRRIPKSDTIARLGECLGLNYLEVHYLNGLAGHTIPTRLPSKGQIVETLDYLAGMLAEFPYPAYVLDYQFRFWVANRATAMFTLGDLDRLRTLIAGPLHVFDILFDARLGFRQQIAELGLTERDQVFRFKASNSFRQHEAFFLAFPDCMSHLPPEDYRTFAALWQAVDLNDVSSLRPLRIAEFYARIEQGDLHLAYPEGVVAFHFSVESVLHLGDLFTVVTLLPVARPENKALAETISGKYVPARGGPLKLWELTEIERLG
jgi:transcriptional regulator with XRE-family HTH domain